MLLLLMENRKHHASWMHCTFPYSIPCFFPNRHRKLQEKHFNLDYAFNVDRELEKSLFRSLPQSAIIWMTSELHKGKTQDPVTESFQNFIPAFLHYNRGFFLPPISP